MKLSKVYSNKPESFQSVEFEEGLNAVLAEIRVPENKDEDTHSLGKSTLRRILDFGFLLQKNKAFFLFKHFDLFKDFVFYFEFELFDASYVTVRRSVEKATKISFKKHEAKFQDFSVLPDTDWDHVDVPFTRARDILDSTLDWRALKPWSYRKGIGYLLRSQEDYRDVFQLRKFAGPHSDWKPFLAHILGFNAEFISAYYDKEKELEKKNDTAQTIRDELGGSVEDISKIEGILLLKKEEAEKQQKLLDVFDFRSQDEEQTSHLVDEIDVRIAELNSERYSLNKIKKKIHSSLEDDQILFNPDDAQRLFEEAGVYFENQIKKDYEQLIEFNRAITDERRSYLLEELTETEDKLKLIGEELNKLGKKRSEILSFLSSTDVFDKYKEITNDMVSLKTDIVSLERQREQLYRLQELRTEIRKLKDELGHLQSEIEEDVEKQNSDKKSLFSIIRIYFNEIVEEVIGQKALLSVSPNKAGHLDFKAEILDKVGNSTSADLGQTYRKLLCIAFDMAVLRAHLNDKFPRFVYHDGVFESLDDRKKEKLLNVIRRYSEYGIQMVITLIDSDLPQRSSEENDVFAEKEIILTLHDENMDGRLFQMPIW